MKMHATRSDHHLSWCHVPLAVSCLTPAPPYLNRDNNSSDGSRERLLIAIDVILFLLVVLIIAAAVVEEHLRLLEGGWSAHAVTTSTLTVAVDLSWLGLLLLLEAIVPVSSGLLLSGGGRAAANKLLLLVVVVVSWLLWGALFRAH